MSLSFAYVKAILNIRELFSDQISLAYLSGQTSWPGILLTEEVPVVSIWHSLQDYCTQDQALKISIRNLTSFLAHDFLFLVPGL